MIIIYGTGMLVSCVVGICVLERIKKKLDDIDFAMGKIQLILEGIQVAIKETKEDQK